MSYRRANESVAWWLSLALVAGAVLLSFVFMGKGGEAEVRGDYLTVANKAVAERSPLLVYVGRHDCEACQRMEKDVLPKLDTRGYALARLYHDVDRRRAMEVMWGKQKAKSLEAMQKTTVPQLMLYLPRKDGRWFKYRLVQQPF